MSRDDYENSPSELLREIKGNGRNQIDANYERNPPGGVGPASAERPEKFSFIKISLKNLFEKLDLRKAHQANERNNHANEMKRAQ